MAIQLPAFVEYPQHDMLVIWGEQQVRIRFTWFERLNAWFFDVFESDVEGAALVLSRRVSPGWLPLLGLIPEGLPVETIPAVDAPSGSDPYQRSALGSSVSVLLLDYETDIVPAIEAEADDVVVVF